MYKQAFRKYAAALLPNRAATFAASHEGMYEISKNSYCYAHVTFVALAQALAPMQVFPRCIGTSPCVPSKSARCMPSHAT